MKGRPLAGLVAAGLLLGSCSRGKDVSGVDDPAIERPSTTVVQLEPVAPYVVSPLEPAADLKQVAVDVVSTIGTYATGSDARSAAARVGPALAAEALADGSPLLGAEASVVEVIYPQLGGLTDAEASVMVVLRHRTRNGNTVRSTTRTVDVRLRRTPAGPMVIGFGSFGGDAAGTESPTSTAQRVVANNRIDLPDSARWDILAGRVDERVLNVLDDLAATYSLNITVFSSGHPIHVFGTDDVSNHTQGRGVDIWGVDGASVFALRGSAALADIASRAIAAGMTEVGGPIDIDGSGGPSFTNTLHQDHVHLAYDG